MASIHSILSKPIAVLCFFIISYFLAAQSSSLRKLTLDDIQTWERPALANISDDGNWVYYVIRQNNGNYTLSLKSLKDTFSMNLVNCNPVEFSNDSKWLTYFIEASAEEKEKLQKANKQEDRKLVLFNLNSKDSILFKDVTSAKFSTKGKHLALLVKKDSADRSKGQELIVRNLALEKNYHFGNVTEYQWSDSTDDVALIITTTSGLGNGVQIFTPEKQLINLLINENAEFKNLVWRPKSNDLAVRKKTVNEKYSENSFDILAWYNVNGINHDFRIFKPDSLDGFPASYRIVESSPIIWSRDGSHIFFRIFPRLLKKTDSLKKTVNYFTYKEAPDVEIWNSKDLKIITEQQVAGEKSFEAPMLCVWNLHKNKFYRLEDSIVDRAIVNTKTRLMYGYETEPYKFDAMFGRTKYNLFAIDLHGKKQLIDTAVLSAYEISPDSHYLVYEKKLSLYLYNFTTLQKIKLDLKKNDFFDLESDRPFAYERSFGFAGWFSAESFLIYSRYDIWKYDIQNRAFTNLTNGAIGEYRNRLLQITGEEPVDYLESKSELYISLFGEQNKKSGVAVLKDGKNFQSLVLGDFALNILDKSKERDGIIYAKQKYNVSPDFYHTSNNFKNEKQLSNTNPRQKEIQWGKSELIEYINHAGKKMQAILAYPADYTAGKKYPMITYIYEHLSDGFHFYDVPSLTNYYSTSLFTHNGYFVLLPDIDFISGDPGIASVQSLESVVGKVIETGMVEKNRIGLVGHSWGGYQAAYVPTQTNIFAASVAGAGLMNLISMYGAITPDFSGAPENGHFEISQERMLQPPWAIPDAYLRNSPVMNIHKLNTPMLIEVGDNDGNVNWRQGAEYYNAARRAGKKMIMLKYAKEGHGLREKKNQIDYHNKILQWFGHYLKGEPAADWIKESIPFYEQKNNLDTWKSEETKTLKEVEKNKN